MLAQRTMVAATTNPRRRRSHALAPLSRWISLMMMALVMFVPPAAIGWMRQLPVSSSSSSSSSVSEPYYATGFFGTNTAPSPFEPKSSRRHCLLATAAKKNGGDDDVDSAAGSRTTTTGKQSYDLGLGKNKPKGQTKSAGDALAAASSERAAQNWVVPEGVVKPPVVRPPIMQKLTSSVATMQSANVTANNAAGGTISRTAVTRRRMVVRDDASRVLRGALWDESHYGASERDDASTTQEQRSRISSFANAPPRPKAFYPDIDLSIPEYVYADDGSVDLVWDLLRWEAYENQQTQHEPLLVSFLHSTILNHPTLESSLAFLLANRLQSPAMMISTQLQALIYDTLQESSEFRRSLRADIMAVRDRDPACNTLPDVFLYFKGFHALQSHRAATVLWNSGRHVLASYLQSQVSQTFQIDIHPNATLGSGIMLDHGTGIVIGETANVGHNCSILHHVTLGGSGKRGVVRHPNVGNGVLLGAGATVLGPVKIGEGSQVGAGTLVISDLPAHCVAVGVPARIIGSFIDVTEQPSIEMNQIMDDNSHIVTFKSEGI